MPRMKRGMTGRRRAHRAAGYAGDLAKGEIAAKPPYHEYHQTTGIRRAAAGR
jgi:hypothetical protein